MSETKHVPKVIHSHLHRTQPSLPAPDVPAALHNEDNYGLIPIKELNVPVIVDLVVWEAALPGGGYQLWWNEKEQGPEKPILDTHKPGDRLTLEIPLDLLSEGYHSVAYRARRANTEFYDYSGAFPIIIDLTAPGKPHLAAIQFPVEVQNGLTAAELTRLGGKLEVEVAGYTGMAKHDVIHTYWGEIEGPTATVTENDMGINKVEFDFSGDFLAAVPEGTHTVTYRVVDRAGNVSDSSIGIDILLLLDETPENFPAPILDPAIGDLIDYEEARAGIKVDIPHYPDAAGYDQITLYWGTDLPMMGVQLPPGNEEQPIVLSLRVPYETIAVKPVGEINISYNVSRQNQLTGSSLSTKIDVDVTLPVPEPTEPMVVQGTSIENPNKVDNFIDEDDYELNARGIIEWNTAFRVSDNLNLFWGDQQRTQWYQIKEEDVAAEKALIIPIANSIMKAQGTGAEVRVHYSVVREGNPNPTVSPDQKVTVRSKEELPGGPDGIDGPIFETNSYGYISQDVAIDGSDGVVAPYVNIAENQKLFFFFKGFDEDGNPIDAATFTDSRELDDKDVENGYSFRVPFRTLRTICSGFCEAYFRVEPAPGSNQSAVTSTTTRVPVEMRRVWETYCPL